MRSTSEKLWVLSASFPALSAYHDFFELCNSDGFVSDKLNYWAQAEKNPNQKYNHVF